jgi:hypothetical protein
VGEQGFRVDFAAPYASLNIGDDFAVDTAAIRGGRRFEKFIQIRWNVFKSNGRHGNSPM